jgi:DNA-directed RNA polymerase subunit K/omega
MLESEKYHSSIMSLDNDDITQIYKNYDVKKNVSSHNMTKYEKALILGQRAEQLANGAEPLIKVPDGIYSVIDIAREELAKKATPFILKRRVGHGYEYWKIEDLNIRN